MDRACKRCNKPIVGRAPQARYCSLKCRGSAGGRRYYVRHREKTLARHKAYRDANPDKWRAKNAAYRAANPDKVHASFAANYVANREKILARGVAYRRAHPEKSAARQRVYRASDPDKFRARDAAYRAAHPEKSLAKSDIRRARENEAFCTEHPACRIVDIRTMAMALRPHECWMCGSQAGPGMLGRRSWPLEHIVPFLRGGKHCIDNVAWACSWCNTWKGHDLIEELYA